jgi:hypothetical protein
MKYALEPLTEGEMIELRKQLSKGPANSTQPRAFNSLTLKVQQAVKMGPKLMLKAVEG